MQQHLFLDDKCDDSKRMAKSLFEFFMKERLRESDDWQRLTGPWTRFVC